MLDDDLAKLRDAGVQISASLDRLQLTVPNPRRTSPALIPLGFLVVTTVVGMAHLTYQQQHNPLGHQRLLWVTIFLALFGAASLILVHWQDRWHASILADLTLTDQHLVLPQRAIPLEEIESVTFTEQVSSQPWQPQGGLQLTLAEETLTVPVPISTAGRGPLVRLIRRHVERRAQALSEGAAEGASDELQRLRVLLAARERAPGA